VPEHSLCAWAFSLCLSILSVQACVPFLFLFTHEENNWSPFCTGSRVQRFHEFLLSKGFHCFATLLLFQSHFLFLYLLPPEMALYLIDLLVLASPVITSQGQYYRESSLGFFNGYLQRDTEKWCLCTECMSSAERHCDIHIRIWNCLHCGRERNLDIPFKVSSCKLSRMFLVMKTLMDSVCAFPWSSPQVHILIHWGFQLN